MTERRQLLDEALCMGRAELQHLVAGEVQEAEKLAMARSRKAQQAIHGIDKVTLQELADQLIALGSLQEELTSEAKKLQDTVKQELMNLRKQSRRFSAYKVGAGYVKHGFNRSRFLSKKVE
ncbi:hypothetical protein [Salidesulfovibrio onnuriiensis]|uniref:hypothetical protein n=1 Tax=Salidesulfovibrio onnuriiensis TaxID=2583823 RepID=UPI0011CC2076|nr:hypothetical protein [Salidesulfovibrio onnuriiensis]